MKLIWTKSNSSLSIFIRFLTGEDCSHFAFVFDSPAGGLMFESNLLGTHPKFYKTAQKHCTIVHELAIPMDVGTEDKIWDLIVDQYDGKGYDFLGALYLGWRCFIKRMLGISKPVNNKWSKPELLYCDELYDVIQASGRSLPQLTVSGGMITPHEVWLRVTGQPC